MEPKTLKSLKRRMELVGTGVFWTSRSIGPGMTYDDMTTIILRLEEEQRQLSKVLQEVRRRAEDVFNDDDHLPW